MIRLILPLILVLVLFSGCSSGSLNATGKFLPPVHNEQLAKAKPCCISYSEIRYSKTNLGEEIKIEISPESQIFEFPDGKSYFAAYELPNSFKAINVKTYPVNMVLNRYGHVLIPAIQFLDERHQLIENIKPQYLAKNPRVIGNSWGEAEVLVPSSARYFIVLDSKSSQGLSWRDPDQRSGYLYVRSGPTGELDILVRK